MTNRYHATPYDIAAAGFFFTDYEEYTEKAASHTNAYGDPIEEYEIQYIDGDSYALFTALAINQATLKSWFDNFEDMDTEDAVKVLYLSDYTGADISDILDHLDEVCLFEGTALDYAEEFIDGTGMLDPMPENLRLYFDTEAFARDLVLGGDITEIEIGGTHYVVRGA